MIPNIPLPEFKKKRYVVSPQRKRVLLTIVFLSVVASILLVWTSVRGLFSSSVSRVDIMSEILRSSENRRKNLFLEWISHLDHGDKSYLPTSEEECRLLQLVELHRDDLAVDQTTETLLALNVASWGAGCAYNIEPILSAAKSGDARLVAGLFLARQKAFFLNLNETSPPFRFLSDLAADASPVLRKSAAFAFENCVSTLAACVLREENLLGDNDEEVRWNAAFVVARKSADFPSTILSRARELCWELFEKIHTQDPEFLSKFDGDSLEAVLRELFSVLTILSPDSAKSKIAELEKSPDLRVRSEARKFLDR